MTATLESNTQAILLLTAPLRSGPGRRDGDSDGGGSDGGPDLLSLGEYNELARALRDRKRAPSDLLSSDAASLIAECRGELEATRIEGQHLGAGRWGRAAAPLAVAGLGCSHAPASSRLRGSVLRSVPSRAISSSRQPITATPKSTM